MLFSGPVAQGFDAPGIALYPRQNICPPAKQAPKIDGLLDDPAWQGAPWTEPFTDIEGPLQREPRLRTRTKMIWDAEYFYVGATLLEPHVWGKLTDRDAVIYYDNDFEVFIDPDGDNHLYFELEADRHHRGMASSPYIPTTELSPSLNTEWRSPLTVGMISFAFKKPLTRKENAHGQVYIGLDAHASSCTAAVLGPSGRKLQCQVLETNAQALISFLQTIPKNRRLIFEEGTHSNWLYEVLAPHVQEIVVVAVRQSRGPKDDKIDAFGLAEDLRIGNVKVRVYKKQGEFATLSHLVRAHNTLVTDTVRCQNRIKSLLRSRGIAASGKQLYSVKSRDQWLTKLPAQAHGQAGLLYSQYDALLELRKMAEKQMLIEARKHPVYQVIKTCPGLGKIRTAQLIPVVVTPYRFANKRQFWAYCGLDIVMRSSSDWVRTQGGEWIKAPIQRTRGLNRNFNRSLKQVFKGAATTVIGCAKKDDPLYRHYQQLLDGGTKPNLAKLTVSRQIASIVLSVWRSQEVYDPKKLSQKT